MDDVPTRVLVPLDGTATAQRALQPAARIARQLRLPLELVTVQDPVYERWARDLDGLAEATDYADVEVEVVSGGWPGDVIVDLTREHPGTLVCLAARHRDRVDRLMLGSVSTHIIQNGVGPVLIVGPGFRPESSRSDYHRLLVCLDGSPRAAAAVPTAMRFAAHAGLHVDLVHVTDSVDEPAAPPSEHEHLAAAARTLRAAGVDVGTTLLAGEDPAGEVARLLSEDRETIAVVGTHGRTGVARMLLGSVTMDLIERSPVPLLITRTS